VPWLGLYDNALSMEEFSYIITLIYFILQPYGWIPTLRLDSQLTAGLTILRVTDVLDVARIISIFIISFIPFYVAVHVCTNLVINK